jgi:hypothetical protein
MAYFADSTKGACMEAQREIQDRVFATLPRGEDKPGGSAPPILPSVALPAHKKPQRRWSEEEYAFLREKWPIPTESARTIADAMGRSRNSIISTVHRIGLGVSYRYPYIPHPSPKRIKKPFVKIELSPPPSKEMSLLDIGSFQCREVTGHNGTVATFCGHDVIIRPVKESQSREWKMLPAAWCSFHYHRNTLREKTEE